MNLLADWINDLGPWGLGINIQSKLGSIFEGSSNGSRQKENLERPINGFGMIFSCNNGNSASVKHQEGKERALQWKREQKSRKDNRTLKTPFRNATCSDGDQALQGYRARTVLINIKRGFSVLERR